MATEWIPDQKQLSKCQRKIRNNIKDEETKKEKDDTLIQKTKHWNYGSNPQKTKSRLGVNTIYPRLDSNIFKKQLSNIITSYDPNDDIHKTASYLLRVTSNINFWLLKGVNNNGDKMFYDHDNGDIVLYKQQLLTTFNFNLSSQIGQSWDVINESLYGCKLCVYYKGNKYHGSWIKVIDRDSFAVAFGVTTEYRMSYCPAILVDIDDIGLMMVLSGSSIIDNKKHIGFGFCNIIKKKRKTVKKIDGHSMIHVLKESKHEVYIQFYAVNDANIIAADIEVTLEPHNLKKNDDHNVDPIRLVPMQNNNEMNDDTDNNEMNENMNNMNNMNVSSMNMMVNHGNMIPNRNMMNPNMRHPPFIDNQLPLNMNIREYNQWIDGTNNMVMSNQTNLNDMPPNPEMMNHDNTNNIDVNNPNMIPNQMEIHNMNQINNRISLSAPNMAPIPMGINMMNGNMSHPQFVDDQLTLSMNNHNVDPLGLVPMNVNDDTDNKEMNDNTDNMTMNGQMNINDMSENPEMMNNRHMMVNRHMIPNRNMINPNMNIREYNMNYMRIPSPIPPLQTNQQLIPTQHATKLVIPPLPAPILDFPQITDDRSIIPNCYSDTQSVGSMGYTGYHTAINWDISSVRNNPLCSISTNTFDTLSNN